MISDLIYELTHIDFSVFSMEDWCVIILVVIGGILLMFYFATKQ